MKSRNSPPPPSSPSHSASISSSGFDKSARCCSYFLDSEGWELVNISWAIRKMAQGSKEEDSNDFLNFFLKFFSLFYCKSFLTWAEVCNVRHTVVELQILQAEILIGRFRILLSSDEILYHVYISLSYIREFKLKNDFAK